MNKILDLIKLLTLKIKEVKDNSLVGLDVSKDAIIGVMGDGKKIKLPIDKLERNNGSYIEDIKLDEDGYMSIVLTNGKTITFNQPLKGKNGISVEQASLNESGQLCIKTSDGKEIQLNESLKGKDGISIKDATLVENRLILHFTDGSEKILEEFSIPKPEKPSDPISIKNVKLIEDQLMVVFTDGSHSLLGKILPNITSTKIINEELIIEFDNGSKLNAGKLQISEELQNRNKLLVEEVSGLKDNIKMLTETKNNEENKLLKVVESTTKKIEPIENQLKIVTENFQKLNEVFEETKNNYNFEKGSIENLVFETSKTTILGLEEKLNKSLNMLGNRISMLAPNLNSGGGGGGFDGGNLEKYMGVKKQAISSEGNKITIDCVYGNTFDVEILDNITEIEFKNWPSTPVSQRIIIYTKNNLNKTITGWPHNLLWADGQIPAVSNGVDCWVFESFDDGSTIFANQAGSNYKAV